MKSARHSVITSFKIVPEPGASNIPQTSLPYLCGYFYCSRDPAEPDRADPACVARTLLKQLCYKDGILKKSLLDEFRRRKEELREEDGDPVQLTIEDCRSLLLRTAKGRPQTVLLIDALDECDPEERDQLFRFLEILEEQSTNPLKILVSSREDGDIVVWRRGRGPSISANSNLGEIRRFINLKVSEAIQRRKLLHGNVSERLRSEIIFRLSEKAERMSVIPPLRESKRLRELLGFCGLACRFKSSVTLGVLSTKGTFLSN